MGNGVISLRVTKYHKSYFLIAAASRRYQNTVHILDDALKNISRKWMSLQPKASPRCRYFTLGKRIQNVLRV